MRTIWKYEFEITDEFELEMPCNAQVLSVQVQKGVPVMWAFIPDTDCLKLKRKFRVFGTGNPIIENENRLQFIGTIQTVQGCLVWHIFEVF